MLILYLKKGRDTKINLICPVAENGADGRRARCSHAELFLFPLVFSQVQMNSGFSSSVPACPGNTYVCLLGSSMLLPSPVLFISAFKLNPEFPIQPVWPPAVLA